MVGRPAGGAFEQATPHVMNTQIVIPRRRWFRFAAVVVAGAFGAASASAAPSAIVKLTNKEFGNGKNLRAQSVASVSASEAFSYTLKGKCTGTGQLAALVKPGTSFDQFMESIKPGSSALLKATFPNPGGKLPAVIIDRKFSGTRDVPKVGKVKVSGTIKGEILSSGKVVFDVRNVKILVGKKPLVGTIRFDKGAQVQVSAAAVISCKTNGLKVNEGDGSVQVVVVRKIQTKTTSTVKFATADDTAVAGTHYVATSGTLTFGRGETEKVIHVALIDDGTFHGKPRFTVNLSNPDKGSVITPTKKTTLVTIADND